MKKVFKLLGIIMIGVSAFGLIGCENKDVTKEDVQMLIAQNGINATLDYYNEELKPYLSKEKQKEARTFLYNYIARDMQVYSEEAQKEFSLTTSGKRVEVFADDCELAKRIIDTKIIPYTAVDQNGSFRVTFKNNSEINEILDYKYVVTFKDSRGNIIKTTKPIKAKFKEFPSDGVDIEVVKGEAFSIEVEVVYISFLRYDYDNSWATNTIID